MAQRTLLFFALLVLVGCGSNQTNESKPVTVVSHLGRMPEDLHPTSGSSAARLEIFHYIHTTLLKDDIVNKDMAPDALEYIPVLDEKTNSYRCKLRENLKFDDGSPVTAQDVLFSFKVQVCPEVNSRVRTNFANIAGINIIDDKTFDIAYIRPNIEDLSLWSLYPILQQSTYDSIGVFKDAEFAELKESVESGSEIQTWAKNFNSIEMGTQPRRIKGLGPYELTAWTEGEIILRKKPDHWTSASTEWFHQNNIDQIVFRFNNDANAQLLDIKNEVIDVSMGFSSSQMELLKTDTSVTNNYNTYMVPTFGISMFTLNLRPDMVDRSPIFSDKDVRLAFAHALPIQKALDKLSSGTSVRVATPLSVNKKEYNDELIPFAFDPEKAKSILVANGWQDIDDDGVMEKVINDEVVDLRIGITIRPHPLFEEIASIMIEGLQLAGFDAYADAQDDWKMRLEETHDFDCLFHSLSSSFGPVYPLGLFESDSYPLGVNYSGYNNPAIDSLSSLISNTFDFAERKKLLFEFQRIVYEDLPYVYVANGKRGVLIHKRFEKTEPSGAIPYLLLNTLKPANQPQAN